MPQFPLPIFSQLGRTYNFYFGANLDLWRRLTNFIRSQKKVFRTLSLSIDVAIIDPTGDSHSGILERDGVGAAATKYEDRKRRYYSDIKGMFSPFIL